MECSALHRTGLEEVLRADERRELREVGEKLGAGQ